MSKFDYPNYNRMKYFLLVFSLFIAQFSNVFGQCPIASFQLPDSICSGGSVTVVNATTSTGPVHYSYDFCSGDLEKAPVSTLVGNFSMLSQGLGNDVVFDGTDYYLFVVNLGSSIIRFDFGNSLLNTPVPTNLGNIGGLIGGCADLKVVSANGQWYGFVISNVATFTRIDFGSSLTNATPTATSINTVGGALNQPYYMNFYESDGHYYALAANTGSSSVTTFDFGTDITNTSPGIGNNTVPGTVGAAAIAKICNNLYVFTAFLGSASITRLEFGTSFANSAAIQKPITINGSIPASREIELATDNGQWYAFMGSLSGSELSIVRFGNNLLSDTANATTTSGANGAFSNGDDGFCLKKFGTDWYGFSVGIGTNDIHRFTFPNTCFSSLSTSTDPSPLSFNLNGGGYQYMSVFVNDSTGDYTYNDSIFINPVPDAGYTVSAACQGGIINFTDTSTISSGSISSTAWDFGDTNTANGTTVQHAYTVATSYTVTLSTTSDKGCTSTVQQLLNVHENPVSDFSFTNNQCAYSDVPFNDLSTSNDGSITNWNWNFGDTVTSILNSPTHPFAPDGNYTVQLIITSSTGCSDTSSQNIQIIPGPLALFTVANTCLGETAQFSNGSSIGGGIGINYDWDFGDLNTSTSINPTNNYSNSAADYSVQLIATATNGCTDTLAKVIHIGEKPVPVFKYAPDTACVGNIVLFTDSSYVLPGENIIARYWDFGDNTYDSLSINPSHTYLTSGTYIVKLTVLSPTYCDSSITHSIFVINSPVANFTTSNVCFGLPTPFLDQSTSPSGSTISSWEWIFGDLDTVNVNNPSHNYSIPGTYSATLNIISSSGCNSGITKQLTVYDLPSVHFGISKACTNSPVLFTDSSTTSSGTLSAWNWTFGDNSAPSSIQNTQHSYINSGAYPITLISTNSFGCMDSLKKFVIVDSSPLFTISALDNCFRALTTFQYVATGTPLPNAGYLWDFGDNTAAFNANPIHLYLNPGSYGITLTVTNLNNVCSTTKTDTVLINTIPTASFHRDSTCVNTSLQLFDLSSISTGNINTWKWTFGSYGNSNLQNPAFNPTVTDSIPVKLLVQSAAGCKDSVTKYVSVYPLPIVNFTPSVTYGGPPLPVSFTNLSNAASYTWDFGDNSSLVSLTNPVHTFTDTGFFHITLIGTSAYGCVNSAARSLSVQIPNLDLAIENISFTEINNLWQIKARVRNEGNVDISSFDLNAKLDGKSFINEIFDADSILAGKEMDISFKSRFTVDNNDNPGYLCLEIGTVNGIQDDDLSDNQKCITTGKDFQVFEVYPNPFIDEINFGLNIPTEGLVAVNLFNLNGQRMKNAYERTLSRGYNSIIIDGSGMEAGVYIAEIRYLDKRLIKKLVRYNN